MPSFRPYLEQEAELTKLERQSRIRNLTDGEAERYAELVYRVQRRGFRLYNRRAGANAFATRRCHAA